MTCQVLVNGTSALRVLDIARMTEGEEEVSEEDRAKEKMEEVLEEK